MVALIRQVNHRLLVGIDYQDRSNNTTGYYGAFPPIDAFNPVYGAKPDYINMYAREKHKLRQTGYYLQDRMSWDRFRITLGGRYDQVSISNIDKQNGTRSDLDKITSAVALLCFICSITALRRTSAIPPPLRQPVLLMRTVTCWNR